MAIPARHLLPLPIIALAALMGPAAPSAAVESRCLVNDPTGTPLNIRSAPNGTILTALENGVRVEPMDETLHQGKRWLLVSRDGVRLGWAFAA